MIITVRILVALMMGWPALAQESAVKSGGDVCDVRPDLCGDAPVKRKKKRVKKKKRVQAKVEKSCRTEDDDSIATADLPICGAEDSELADDIEREIRYQEEGEPRRAPANARASERPDRAPKAKSELDSFGRGTTSSGSSSAGSKMSFDSYMQSNASHPALSSSTPARQQNAFQETRRPASLPTASSTTSASSASGSGIANGGQSAPPLSGVVEGTGPTAAPLGGETPNMTGGSTGVK